MHVIHFTVGATDPLLAFAARRVRLVPLAHGESVRVSCLHLSAGSALRQPPKTFDCTLLLVHGEMMFTLSAPSMRLKLSAGVGVALGAGETYMLESAEGAIVVVIESPHLQAHECGISSPERIWGARWPGEKRGHSAC